MAVNEKNTICLIDDAFPVIEAKLNDEIRLNENDLSTLIGYDWGVDNPLKDLVTQLLDNPDKWSISAFTHPNIFFNYFYREQSRNEVIVFDWEYSGQNEDSKDYLIEILENSFSIVYIYTGREKQHEVSDLLKSAPLIQFKNRLTLLHKQESNSHAGLYEHAREMVENNFSMKFGKEIRMKSCNATEKTLVELGKVTSNEISNYFSVTEQAADELIEFLGERYKNYLNLSNVSIPTEAEQGESFDNNIKEIWSYRLYHCRDGKDVTVRKGDIIQKGDEKTLYLVITADCDLARFWNKNYGVVNLLPLHLVSYENQPLINKVTLCKTKGDIKKEFIEESLAAGIKTLNNKGPFIFPFLKVNNEFGNYVAFPKEIECEEIPKPSNLKRKQLKDEKLTYTHLNRLKLKRITTLSEPFLTPVISHIFATISGYGTPDYPPAVKDTLRNEHKVIFEKNESD